MSSDRERSTSQLTVPASAHNDAVPVRRRQKAARAGNGDQRGATEAPMTLHCGRSVIGRVIELLSGDAT